LGILQYKTKSSSTWVSWVQNLVCGNKEWEHYARNVIL